MAVLVALVVVVVDEVVEVVELLDGAMRLVAACKAADKLLVLPLVLLELDDGELAFEVDAFDVIVIVGLSVDVVLDRSRPNCERLPRSAGVSNNA
jgi:hypothetical protein